MVLTLTLMSVLYPFMYNATWKIYLGAFLLPFAGFLFGYIVASICRMEHLQRRTVALETGIQNFPLCMTLLSLSFSREVFAEISLFPLLYGVTCILASIVFAVAYQCRTGLNAKFRTQNDRRHNDRGKCEEEKGYHHKETSKFLDKI